MWLAHLQGWQSSGVPMAQYARREGFDADAAYRWKRILRRDGQWVDGDGTSGGGQSARIKKPKSAVRFARVAVGGSVSSALQLRLVLSNGRRAELDIGGVSQLGEVLEVLERAA
jgi:hypothetical protein